MPVYNAVTVRMILDADEFPQSEHKERLIEICSERTLWRIVAVAQHDFITKERCIVLQFVCHVAALCIELITPVRLRRMQNLIRIAVFHQIIYRPVYLMSDVHRCQSFCSILGLLRSAHVSDS